MRVLVPAVFALGAFVTTPVAFALSGTFIPLGSEQADDDVRRHERFGCPWMRCIASRKDDC